MEKLGTSTFGVGEERVAWEGLAAACNPPLRRLGAFLIVGFVAFVAATTVVVLVHNLFGPRLVDGQGVPVPAWEFYATMAFGLLLALGGFAVWLTRSLKNYRAFAGILRRGGLDPERPTTEGLRAYSDEQLLALRSRYEKAHSTKKKASFERIFGFRRDDSFSLAPLSVLPGTFEMGALRVEWESNLLLCSGDPMPPITWWGEGRLGLLPRQPNETRRLVYALRYTGDSVRELKRRYGYRTEGWHRTVPEGRLWDAVRDLEEARRIRVALSRRPRDD